LKANPLQIRCSQALLGSFVEHSAARPALCTALVRFDPVEVHHARGALSRPTLAALGAHCRPAGGAGAGAVLSPLAPGACPGGAGEALAVLAAALPPAALSEPQGMLQGGGRRPPGSLALQALAMAVAQLQRCGLAGELLPALLISPLEVDGAPGGCACSSCAVLCFAACRILQPRPNRLALCAPCARRPDSPPPRHPPLAPHAPRTPCPSHPAPLHR
jgi:hypothetical protein